jgi:hypothetical protein
MECFLQFTQWFKTKMFLAMIKVGEEKARMFLTKKAKCLDKIQEECTIN